MRYWTYEQRTISDNNFQAGVKLEGKYDLSFFLDYPEYQNIKITSVTDWASFISDSKYNTNVKLVEFDTTMTEQELTDYIATIPWDFNATLLADNSAVSTWIKANTTCTEESANVFVLQEEIVDELLWTIPKRTLNLN